MLRFAGILVFSLSFTLLSVACDDGDVFIAEQPFAGEMETGSSVRLAQALMVEEVDVSDDEVSPRSDKLGGCIAARNVALFSGGDAGLYLRVDRYASPDCESHTAGREMYRVESARLADGGKVYRARTDEGELWLHDNRASSFKGLMPWALVVHDSSGPKVPWNYPWDSYFADSVDDVNRTASGHTTYRVELTVSKQLSAPALERLVHPLVIEELPTDLEEARELATPIELGIVSDLAPDHVLSQLRVLEVVEKAELLEVVENL